MWERENNRESCAGAAVPVALAPAVFLTWLRPPAQLERVECVTALRCPGGCVSIRAVAASPAVCLPRSLRCRPVLCHPRSPRPHPKSQREELSRPLRSLLVLLVFRSWISRDGSFQREQNGAQREELSSDQGLCKSSQLHSNEFITRSFSTKFSLKTVISACGITQCIHPECLTLFQKAFFSPRDKKLRLGSELIVERLLCLSPWIRGFIIPNYGIISGHTATASALSSSACFTF